MENSSETPEGNAPFAGDFPPPRPLKKACRKCLRLVGEGDNYCPHCGARLGGGDGWYYRPFWILVLSLAVLGPFGLFFVWKSPHMGRTAKWVMAAVILVYSVAILYSTYELVVYDIRKIRELMELMRRVPGR